MSSVKHFKIVGDVIRSMIDFMAVQSGATPQVVCDCVVKYLKENSKEWTSNKKPRIRYQDPLCRMAYLYGIVPVNANFVEHVFENEPELEDYLDSVQARKGQVGICAFGGGPGTELLGLAKRIESRCALDQMVLDFLLLDRVNEWLESWQAIRRSIEAGFKATYGPSRNGWPLILSGSFSAVDIANADNFANLGALFGQDVYIFSYVISEVFDSFQDLRSFTSRVASQAPLGSKFLFIDRKGQLWKDEISKLAAEANIALSDFHNTQSNMSADEEKSDLGQIFVDVGRNPRITWNSFWVVGTKV